MLHRSESIPSRSVIGSVDRVIAGAIFVVLLVLGAVAEFWIYDKAMWWHSDTKADRRNWTPPR